MIANVSCRQLRHVYDHMETRLNGSEHGNLEVNQKPLLYVFVLVYVNLCTFTVGESTVIRIHAWLRTWENR